MRLTIDIEPDPDARDTWIATCLELGVTSRAVMPQIALSSVANAVRAVVSETMAARRLVDASAGIEVMREIAAGYAALRQSSGGAQ